IALPLRLIVNKARARIGRLRRRRQLADHLSMEVVAVKLARLVPLLRVLGEALRVKFRPVVLPGFAGIALELLGEGAELIELSLLACTGVEGFAEVSGWRACWLNIFALLPIILEKGQEGIKSLTRLSIVKIEHKWFG